MDERSYNKHGYKHKEDEDDMKRRSDKEYDEKSTSRPARHISDEQHDRRGHRHESYKREQRDDRHRGRDSMNQRALEHPSHNSDEEKIKNLHHRHDREVHKHVDTRSSNRGKMRGWDDNDLHIEQESFHRHSYTSGNREHRRHRDSSGQRYAPPMHPYDNNRSSVTNSNERSTLDVREDSRRRSASHRSRSRSISSGISSSDSEHSRLRRSASPRSRSRENSGRRTDGPSSKEDDKKKRKGRDRSKSRSRDNSRERDRKRRKRKEKERKHKRDTEERRSVLTGKKIKLKVKKDKFDVAQDANRENLLKFLNSTFE